MFFSEFSDIFQDSYGIQNLRMAAPIGDSDLRINKKSLFARFSMNLLKKWFSSIIEKAAALAIS